MTDIRNRIVDFRTVSASELTDNPKNWRKHPPKQRKALRAMMERVGYIDAVIARQTESGLVLIDGHLRKDLAEDAQVPVLIVDLDEREADEVLATLDPVTGMAELDSELLDSLLTNIANDADEVLAGILKGVHGFSTDQPADEEPLTGPPPARVNPGELWALGSHRLLCGDATDAAHVARLLDGNTPRLMITDPPYGVNYDPEWRNRYDGAWYKQMRVGNIAQDTKIQWQDALDHYKADVLYMWSPAIDLFIEFGRIIQSKGFQVRAQIVWRKSRAVMSRGHYNFQHEPCWYAVRKGAKAGWAGDKRQTTVWDIHWDPNVGMGQGGHGTQRPLECMERPMRNHEGDVYDPFVGSGTTLIAAERLKRTAYCMEIEPQYCDMTIARWEQYTERVAELVSEGA